MQSMYKVIRKYAPDSFNGKMKQLYTRISGKPAVKKDAIDPSQKFPNNEKGGLIITADFEMSWAWRYTKTGADYLSKGKIERENFPGLIEILDTHNIPVTFATVGHLFLEKCNKGDHDWMHRLPHFDDHWKFTEGDWYDHDPYTNVSKNPEWYAPDLIRLILDSDVEHEIGSHTFSHIDLSYKNCPARVAEDEISACIDAAKNFGIALESLVFPGGTWGNIEILKKYGIKIYRKKGDFGLAYPYRDEYGLLVTLSSGMLEYNLDYGWPEHYVINRLKTIVQKAVKTNTIAHLWFHPSLDPFILKNVFPVFLAFAADMRESGDLWIGTMNKIAGHINSKNLL